MPPSPDIEPEWHPSPNYTARGLTDVVAFLVHTMGGSYEGTLSWFANPASQVSTHFSAAVDGRLAQHVVLANAAWGNGRLEPGNKWSARYGTEWPNGRTISCETEDKGDPHQPVTDAEYAATLSAGRLALAAHPGIEVVSSHHVISPQSRPQCCGDRWIASGRLAELAADLGLELFI